MVLVAVRGREEEVVRVFEKWGLPVDTIGRVTEDGRARLLFEGKVVADMPVLPLTQSAPEYRRPVAVPKDLAARQADPEVPEPEDPRAVLERLLSSPELGSKEWIWSQYDHSVRTNTIVGPGGDAAVLRLKGTPSALALTSEVNPVYCWLDPYRGASQAVAEAVRNLACVGAEAVGLTDCLNFGNPERPEIAWQFREAVRGMSEACRKLSVPVVSGNVSFYNETQGAGIYPTPTVAVVGVIETLKRGVTAHFVGAGDRILLLGADFGEFGGSAYLRMCHDLEQGRPPKVDLDAEKRLAALLRASIADGSVGVAHDLSVGGLAVALAEATFGAGVGAEVEVDSSASGLFSESQARALVAVSGRRVDEFLARAGALGVPATDIGSTGGDRLVIRFDGGVIDSEVEALRRPWSMALPRALEG
jgi:phosphoribosylformylglycinamidine synthase